MIVGGPPCFLADSIIVTFLWSKYYCKNDIVLGRYLSHSWQFCVYPDTFPGGTDVSADLSSCVFFRHWFKLEASVAESRGESEAR